MATTKPEIKKLVTRLVQLPAQDKTMFGVDGQEIRDEIGRVLERWAKNDDHARRLVDWLLFDRDPDQRKWRPTPGEIREAAEAVPTDRPEAFMCPECSGHGFHHKTVLQWREKQEDGSWRLRRRYVPDLENGWEEAKAMKAEKEATCYESTVDCECRKKTIAATEPAEARKA